MGSEYAAFRLRRPVGCLFRVVQGRCKCCGEWLLLWVSVKPTPPSYIHVLSRSLIVACSWRAFVTFHLNSCRVKQYTESIRKSSYSTLQRVTFAATRATYRKHRLHPLELGFCRASYSCHSSVISIPQTGITTPCGCRWYSIPLGVWSSQWW